MNKQVLVLSIMLALVSLISCKGSADSKEVKKETPRSMTSIEETAKDILIRRISKVGIKYLDGDELVKLSESIANEAAINPQNIIPLMSFYDFYSNDYGLHYNHDNWLKLRFYKDVVGKDNVFYETNFKFTAMDKKNILYWRNTAVFENGKLLEEKLGGRLMLLSTELSCVEGVYLKFYLEDKQTVLCDNISDDFTCDLSKGIGAALEYFDLERLSKSPIKAVELIDKSSNKAILLPVDNPFMKEYFIQLKEQFDQGVN